MSSQHNKLKLEDTQSVSAANDTRIEGKVEYEQGTDAARIQFTIICTNIPIGSTVGFKSDKPGPNPPIELNPTPVLAYPSFITGILSDVPANYAATIYYYADLKQAPPPGAKITLQAAYPMHG